MAANAEDGKGVCDKISSNLFEQCEFKKLQLQFVLNWEMHFTVVICSNKKKHKY